MVKNKFKNIIGKKSTGIITTILAFVVVLGAVFANSNLTIAADSLPGIESIRNEITDANAPYRILEIVPNREVAQFGFLVGGQEPLSVGDLYDSANNEWMSWQEYLTLHTEDLTPAQRETFMANLATANSEYVSMGAPSSDKPMWYETYTEAGVDENTAGANVLYGGNTPVYGWLVGNDNMTFKGWNAKFTQSDDGLTLDEYLGEEKPYYMVDTAPNSVIDITETNLKAGDVYPTNWYVYRMDTNGVYLPSMTVGELYAACEADTGLYTNVGDYKIVRFKLFTETDKALAPWIYEASDFEYLQNNAPYIIETPAPGVKKGHNLKKPSHNVYYTGGFHSNEWFKQYVLDIEPAQVSNYNIEVVTMTAGELGDGMTRDELTSFLSTIDFIYINPGEVGTYEYNAHLVDSSLDLDNDALELIFEKICKEKTPCIADYSILKQGETKSDLTDSRVYALTALLMQDDYRSYLSAGEFDIATLTDVSSWVTSKLTTNNYNYVNENVMVINSTVAGYDLLDNFHTTKYSSDEVSTAYADVLSEIEVENMYRASDQAAGYDALSTDIYKSTVIRYIMHFITQREYEKKTVVNVLEIQPANVKYSDNNGSNGAVADTEMRPSRIRKWLGVDSSVTVNITTMNTMEFIGTIEDLNSEYDLIYIGADIYGLPKRDSSSRGRKVPDYYGSDMDYLIYSNVGGLTPVSGQFSGHLETDWVTKYTLVKKKTTARYNGNDITADKHNELVDFIKGTYPIVVADVLCTDVNTPSGDTVDNCTYLYSLLNEHLKDANVFKASEVENGKNSTFKFYANRGKLDIGKKVIASEETSVTTGTAFIQPGTYKTGKDTTQKNVTYISKENDKYYLRYKFTITNNGAVYDSTKYTAALFLDSNSDGKFSLEYEKIPDITLTHVASGKTVKNGELIAGEQYALTRQVPDSYSGVLTWKVEVSQSNNKFIRDSVTGYTRLAETEQAVIKVLQVRRDGGSPLVLEKAIGNSAGTGNNNTLSTLVWGGYCNADGVTYEGIYNDFKFQFTTLKNYEFNNKYADGTLNLMDYDMLVLGFYDSYNLRNGTESDINYNAVNGPGGIKEYIDSGKSVLFAHDTTSVTVVKDYSKVYVQGNGNGKLYDSDGTGANVWGYNLNMYIRDMVGLDTYGITLTTKNNVDYTPVKSGKDLNETSAGRKLMKALKNTLDDEGYYKIGLKALAYLPRSNKAHTVPETQGFLYGWMDWHWRGDTATTYRAVRSKYNTDRAERVNEGQITTYPYYLDETIDITRTHHQYFTLDLNTDDDGDGETDLVVWYTMGGKAGDKSHQDTKYYTSNESSTFGTNKEANFDDTSEKDVMNNYYIYNKGNITYTGFGDFDNNTWLSRATIVEECKLFINTLVAAYNTSVKEPQITVYESDENLTPTAAFYEYGDIDNDVAFRENTQRMYFSVNDLNVIRGTKSATAEYYVQLKDGVATGSTTYTANGVTYPLFKKDGKKYIQLTNLKTYTSAGAEVAANNLQCGQVYYVDIPTSVFDIAGVDGQNVNKFMLASKTVLKKTGSLTGKVTTVETARTYSSVEFIHVELFPLD